ncbi:MAG: hypothetical protein ONB46_00415 [candidate division KSB1 bacterium]|nr:hypothetical protein [candidate division KSB1 bacterium]MDZ7364693.1 hypothetical protein [candidate division KSB1 bacterium]MDZ7402559.1 hypothetical protein [candidate division KSB1 bacterium]
MNRNHKDTTADPFSPIQKKTLLRFKKKLEKELPALRVTWAQPYNDTIIELHLDYDRRTYRKIIKASKVATEVEDETGVTIIFR